MKNTLDQGFTLVEVLAALAIIGVLSAVSAPLILWANNPIQNATSQTSGILSQARSRAIATTSSIRVAPDPDSPDNTFKVEASNSRSCNPGTTALVGTFPQGTTLVKLSSTKGFSPGDKIKIGQYGGEDDIYSIVTTDSMSSTLTLGEKLRSAKSGSVEILANWKPDRTFFETDLTFPDDDDIEMSSNLTDDEWVVCFDSRGIAHITDDSEVTTADLEITLRREQSNKVGKVVISQGDRVISNSFDENASTAAEEEADRIAAEAEVARIAAEEAETARIAAEEAEADRIAAEEAEAARIAAEEAETARIAAEEAEIAEQAEAARIAAEKAEAARIAAEKAEAARIAAEKAEAARIAAEKAKADAAAAEEARAAEMICTDYRNNRCREEEQRGTETTWVCLKRQVRDDVTSGCNQWIDKDDAKCHKNRRDPQTNECLRWKRD